MVKVFMQNKDGKIEFTKDELEKLLNEVWWDGRKTSNYWWTSPTTPTWYSTNCTYGVTGHAQTGVSVETEVNG